MEVIRKQLEITERNTDEQIVGGYITTANKDRHGDIVEPKGVDTSQLQVLLENHDATRPVGRLIDAETRADGVFARFKVVVDDTWEKVKAGLRCRSQSMPVRSRRPVLSENFTHLTRRAIWITQKDRNRMILQIIWFLARCLLLLALLNRITCLLNRGHLMRIRSLLVAVAFLALPSTVLAGLITFENLSGDEYFDEPQISGGFIFDDFNSDSFGHGTNGIDNSTVNNGTQMLWDWSNNADPTITRMRREGGGTFALTSFDFASGYLNGSQISETLTVQAYLGGSTLGSATVFDFGTDFSNTAISTLSVNISGADEVRFAGSGGTSGVFQEPRNAFDNFAVDINEVPEPAAIALFGLGLAGLGWSRRKQRN